MERDSLTTALDSTGHLTSLSFSLSGPKQLMQALSDPAASDILAWLDHGNGFVILQKRRFALEIMPRHFGGRASGVAKFTSFTRKLNRWGFKRVTKGKEMGAYYQDDFRRGGFAQCARMRPLHGPGATKVGAVADYNEKNDAKEEEEEEVNTTKEGGPAEDATDARSTKVGDDMPSSSSSSLSPKGVQLSWRQMSIPPSATFDLSHWNIRQQQHHQEQQQQPQQHRPLLKPPFRLVMQDAPPVSRFVQHESHQQQPSPAQGSSVQPSPMQKKLQQLSLLRHQQQLLQQHQLQQPLMPILSKMSLSGQQQQHLLQQQHQLNRTSRQADTACSRANHNPLGVDTTSLRKRQQVISNALSVLQSHRDRGLLDISASASTAEQEKRRHQAADGITTPHLGRTSANMGGAVNGDASSPLPAQHDVQGHAKMRARLREVEDFDVATKRQRTVTSPAETGGRVLVGDHATLLAQLKQMREMNRRLAAAKEVVDLTGTGVGGTVLPARGMGGASAKGVTLKSNYTAMTQSDIARLLNEINAARTQFATSNVSARQPPKKREYSRPVRRASAA